MEWVGEVRRILFKQQQRTCKQPVLNPESNKFVGFFSSFISFVCVFLSLFVFFKKNLRFCYFRCNLTKSCLFTNCFSNPPPPNLQMVNLYALMSPAERVKDVSSLPVELAASVSTRTTSSI